jgi:urea transporter/murein DD-endopeptidase MepM/ murein hydrolase activator NlpD
MFAGAQNIVNYLRGIVLSYSQVYFSNSIWLGIALLIISFFDPGIGIAGIIAIVTCQISSLFFNFNRASVFDGAYTYNALLMGLAMGSFYQMSLPFLFVLVITAMLTFFLTVWIAGRLGKIGLPFLSLPFLIAIWVAILGLSNFTGIKLVSRDALNLQSSFPEIFRMVTNVIEGWSIRNYVHLYLRSLSAVIFQYNDLSGLLIAVCLLFRSRMAFALSLYGFAIGYLFYFHFEGDFTPLIYSYIGFNFILAAIALGGFFIVPSTKSHFLLLFVIPVTALLLSALHTVFSYVHLPLYSLPFTIVVLLVLGVLQMRQFSSGLELVSIQQYSPELNHYKTLYLKKRFAGQTYFHVFLPVIGEWYISQGHEGAITHKEGWKYAWDFVVRDELGNTFRAPGTEIKDYYCYDMPVIAPSSGYVIGIKDGIADNLVSKVNLNENWGNTVIIKHAEGLYSNLSHLKPGSIKVREGDWIHPGDLVGTCGSSGRSPEPHLHFQVQANPYFGSQTMRYPIAYYLVKEKEDYSFHSFSIPKEGQVVRNIIPGALMTNAFDFIPGRVMTWNIYDGDKIRENKWSVFVDIYNKKYLYCQATKATAYFVNDGVLFYFTDFYGDKSSFLYQFYISFHKVILGCYKGITLTDWLMPQVFFDPFTRALQDFVAPFYHFLDGIYKFNFGKVDNYTHPSSITLETNCRGRLFSKDVKQIDSELLIDKTGIAKVEIKNGNKKIKASCVY